MANNNWLELSQQLHNELNEIKRNALVPYLISKKSDIEDERDLYEKLLIDVEMGSCGTTSKVEEAIAATQLYFHRYFINLEIIELEDPITTRKKLRTYWQWMKNYRIWEANRKVFLHPENYIRPELRDTKTPEFKALEEELLQAEITEESAQKAFQKYLDEYTEVSRLTIAGGYVYDSKDLTGKTAKNLVLFGRTKTDPRRYYYRLAQFLGSEKANIWNSWLKVNVQIDADKVYPVFAFNRVFVFWVKLETIASNLNTTALTVSETSAGSAKNQTVQSNTPPATYVLRIYYSFYDLNKNWVPIQTLRPKDENAEKAEVLIPAGVAIEHIKINGLLVETSNKLDIPGTEGEHENIIIQCTYEVPLPDYSLAGYNLALVDSSKQSLPEKGVGLVAIAKDAQGKLHLRIFNHRENKVVDIREADFTEVDLNNKRAYLDYLKALPYSSIDTIVSSLRYQESTINNIVLLLGYNPSANFPPFAIRRQAFSLTPELYAVKIPNRIYFDNTGQTVFKSIFDEPEIPADQVVIFNTAQQSSDAPWFSFDYRGGSFLCKPDVDFAGNLLPIKLKDDKTNGLIRVISTANSTVKEKENDSLIDAAIELSDDEIVFFKNSKNNSDRKTPQKYVVLTSLAEGSPGEDKEIKADWGKINNNIETTGTVDAAYIVNGKTYLFSGNQYFVYSQSYDWVDAGYPQLITEAGNENFPKWQQIDAIFQDKNGKTYFFNNEAKKYFISGEKVEKDIIENWGNIPSLFIKGFTAPPEDPDAPSVDAGLVYRGDTYVINRKGFVKSTNSDYDLIEPGYPKSNTLLNLLKELNYTPKSNEETQLAKEFIVASYDIESTARNQTIRGATIYFTTGEGTSKPYRYRNYEYKDGKLRLLESDKALTAGFEVNGTVYQFAGRELEVSGSTEKTTLNYWISAAFVGTDNQIYIFRNGEYISFAKTNVLKTIVDTINAWSNSKKDETKWGKISNNIARTGQVDAAFFNGEKTYLCSGDEYLVYSGRDYSSPDSGYPKKIKANNENLPKWDKIDAVLITPAKDGSKGDIYFFDNQGKNFIKSASGNQESTKDKWGKIKNNIAEQGIVDAAFIKDFVKDAVSKKFLFLISGNQIFRYTLENGTRGNFVDFGYPKLLNLKEGQINAVFTLGDSTYLFSGDRYTKVKLPSDSEIQTLPELPGFKLIRGNWGNIPKSFMSGLDAVLNTSDGHLFLFKGDSYFKYENISDTSSTVSSEKESKSTASIKPFEIDNVDYEIVRLTTSTAYRLNQRLFAGGLQDLLSLSTQEIDDTPSFSFAPEPTEIATTIKVKATKVKPRKLPNSSHLDFLSANSIYYWEIFFYAPFLIAQTLNLGQKFEAAKSWYEYIYDPSSAGNYWQFLPFLSVDIKAVVGYGRQALLSFSKKKTKSAEEKELIKALDTTLLTELEKLEDAFLLRREFTQDEVKYLNPESIKSSKNLLNDLKGVQDALKKIVASDATQTSLNQIGELIGVIEQLAYRYKLLLPNDAQIDAYLTDPFDPHAIAALRPAAYQKTIVMAYIDNLIDWGDMLFQQYTRESINEARMLYILAYDLLGAKPQKLGRKILSEPKPYTQLLAKTDKGTHALLTQSKAYDFLVYPPSDTPNDKVSNSYFFIPENSTLTDYWSRVEDRLYKIRHCMNIMGISQPMPLFEPPIDPMALVRSVTSGIGLSSALASLNIAVPHYRFSFMLRKAQDLVQKLSQFGADLLGALEKKDSEELSLLQNRQEGIILSLTRSIKEAQLKEAENNLQSLQSNLLSATAQAQHYQNLLTQGLLKEEVIQIAQMQRAANLTYAAGGTKIGASIIRAMPEITIGLFSFGSTIGGDEIGGALDLASEVLQTFGEACSLEGEALGVFAQFLRSKQDWELQKATADSEIAQIKIQIEGANLQKEMAKRELEILEQQIAQNESISLYMKEKFSNAQLYQWMASKLSGLYFQTYQMAFDIAKAAEKAFQFERGMKESDVNFISGPYWDSQKKGLLAGDSLGFDLDRMEKAYIDSDRRGFEITKNISLLDLDPMALLQLKTKGVCEFSFQESLFDYDFPGHYCRQIRTVSLSFEIEEGQTVMATLTQLSNKTVLEADPKAVKYLLDPKGQPPESIRHDWKSNQQIALSHVEEGEKNNGLFELRFDDDRYLPFENTGVVSTWQLELNGKKNSYNVNTLRDVIINLKYTAEQGGEIFANTVKGLLKPYPTARYFDIAQEFPDEWTAFIESEEEDLILPMSRDFFPNMSSSKITGIFTHYDLLEPGSVSMVLNRNRSLTLKDGKYLLTNELSISNRGAEWTFVINGDRSIINNMGLVLSYKASVT